MCKAPNKVAMSMDTLTDEALCRLAASGDRRAEETLVSRYTRLVRSCARPYFLAGGDSEDLTQEGMLGLIKAVREFQADKDTFFRTFLRFVFEVGCILLCGLRGVKSIRF